MSWGPEKLLKRCSKESHRPAEWASGPPVEPLENEKDTKLTAIRVGVKILQFLFVLQLPLTRKHCITFSNPYNKMRGTYFSKEVFLRLSLSLCRCELFYIYMCMYVDVNLHMRVYNTTPFPGFIHFTLDPYIIMLSVRHYHFWVFGMTRPGIEPRSPGLLAKIDKEIANTRKKLEGNLLNRYFKRQAGTIAHLNTWTWLWRGNIKRKPEFLLITPWPSKSGTTSSNMHIAAMWGYGV